MMKSAVFLSALLVRACIGFSVGGVRSIRRESTRLQATEDASVCVIGGGVSGLAAALTAANAKENVILLEASDSFGGRVQSDVTESGFTLDRGFAVFIEEYPFAKELLDYDSLDLGKFLPGALVKIADSDKLARVSE
jgi:phytoene dehydrogenase-like protein